ncbi:hypothetical protein [Haladaptatus caseinilyticus]|uniref:hypothetical protein n=1 Tax=Haladaptatus caseinilyticus TaxID=2993314 RepID=UPI00224A5F81|nr:hypothetical protein [Haladaptatus caseinilyticus]
MDPSLKPVKIGIEEVATDVFLVRYSIDDIVVAFEIQDGVASIEYIKGTFRPWFHLKGILAAERETGNLFAVKKVETIRLQYNQPVDDE